MMKNLYREVNYSLILYAHSVMQLITVFQEILSPEGAWELRNTNLSLRRMKIFFYKSFKFGSLKCNNFKH